MLAYAVLMLAAQRLGAAYGAGAAFLVPVLEIPSAAWFFHDQRSQ